MRDCDRNDGHLACWSCDLSIAEEWAWEINAAWDMVAAAGYVKPTPEIAESEAAWAEEDARRAWED
jgi:hypothetical protein